MDQENADNIPMVQKFIAVLWPSFLVAGVETILFFTILDPQFVFYEYNISRMGAYSAGFFLFWLFSLITGILTLYFVRCRPRVDYQQDSSKP